ncbi:10957_t:CDS:2, partial [Racocetra persica]
GRDYLNIVDNLADNRTEEKKECFLILPEESEKSVIKCQIVLSF